jgi:hypothetical protein
MTISNPFDLVAVAWDDAHGSINVDIHKDKLGGVHAPFLMMTVGFLLEFDEVGISVANEVGQDGEYRGHTFVPFDNVREIRLITNKRLSKRPLMYAREE